VTGPHVRGEPVDVYLNLAPPEHASVGRAALAACTRGWSVLPMHTAVNGRCSCRDPACPAPGKHPRIVWEAFTRVRAGTDEIERWWRRWPQANVGVVTGTVSDLVVLDIDPRHGR
jgi:Bifunctional DNA primase/polymerase, N-terminal